MESVSLEDMTGSNFTAINQRLDSLEYKEKRIKS